MKRNVYLNMKGLTEAEEIFAALWRDRRTEPERVSVKDSLGRVTSEPVFAVISAPTYHAAAMDGISVRAKETYGTTERSPKILKTGRDAIWVNTGHAMPEDFDSVIMVEKVHRIDDENLEIRSSSYPWQNVRKVGEDIVATELLLPRNHVIRPYDMGAMVTAGVNSVMVRKKPRVVIIPTGSELVKYDDENSLKELKKGKIIESNSVTLSGLVMECHGIPVVTEIIEDRETKIQDALLNAVDSNADIIIINAGSSAGSKDYTASIIGELGELLVHGVGMMPGKPTILGKIKDKPVIGNPGYVVSAVLSFDRFVRPLLYNLQGLKPLPKPVIKVRPSRDIPSKLGLEEFVRVNIGKVEGKAVATPLSRAAGSVTTLTRAEGIIRIPSFSEGVTQEEELNAELLVDEGELDNTVVIIGSHDITIDIIADEIRKEGKNIRISSGNVGSLGGLIALKKGISHLGGSHLLDVETGEYNISYIKKYLQGLRVSVYNLVLREQGLIVPAGNPKGIKGLEDLTGDDIHFVNRQAGSGTRILLDYKLKQAGIEPSRIKGYDNEDYTHMAVAVDVLSNAADCGMGIYAAARALGLDFIPLAREQYDLLIPSSMVKNQNIQDLLETIGTERFKRRVEALGGYDPSRSGELWMEV